MRLIALLLLTCLLTFPAAAQNAPIPQKKVSAEQLDKKIKSGKANKAELEKNLKDIDKDLKSTKSELIDTAKAVQKNEKQLQKLDKEITQLEDRKTQLSEQLQKERGSIANLILALERIRRLPPEALIVKPDAPLKTAQSAMLLKDILPTIHKQAEELKVTLKELEDTSANLQARRNDAAARGKKLESQHKELDTLLKKRADLYASTQKDLKAQKAKIARISTQAKNLQDLVKKLEDERTRAQQATPKPQPREQRVVSNEPPGDGKPRLPLPGILKTAYNEPDNFGAPSQGIDIEGRAGALVVAPMGGIIRFAGYFKNYGNMLIIEHEKGWHSLVAGLENIDTVVGQPVNAGEPLGVLHKSTSGQRPVLYYELRLNGKPVNPAKKFGDLS